MAKEKAGKGRKAAPKSTKTKQSTRGTLGAGR